MLINFHAKRMKISKATTKVQHHFAKPKKNALIRTRSLRRRKNPPRSQRTLKRRTKSQKSRPRRSRSCSLQNPHPRSKSTTRSKDDATLQRRMLPKSVHTSKPIWQPSSNVAAKNEKLVRRQSVRLKRPARERSRNARPITSCSCASSSCLSSKTSTSSVFASSSSATSTSTSWILSSYSTTTTLALSMLKSSASASHISAMRLWTSTGIRFWLKISWTMTTTALLICASSPRL